MKYAIRKILLVTTLLTLGAVTRAQENEPLKPPGQMVDVGGYQLYFHVKGDAETTIVIEPGTGSWSLQWLEFQNELSKYFKVVTYDRAGYGLSEPSPYSRTAGNIAEELHTGLINAEISAPYILLGHSYGGLIVKAFTNKYPDEVSAFILADAATEYQFALLPEMVLMILEAGMQRFRQTGLLARMGKFMSAHIPVDSTLNSKYWEVYKYSASRASFYDAMYNEMDLLILTYKQSQFSKLIDKPILVITAENSFGAFSSVPNLPVEECNEVWAGLQKNQLTISSNSKQYIIKNATHDLLLTASNELSQVIIEFVNGLN